MSESWKRNLPVPFFSQRENKYIWKRIAKSPDGEDYKGKHYNPGEMMQEVSLAWASCNITSLCMILHYFGITDETPDDMMRKFFEIKITRPGTKEKFENDFRHEEYHPEINGDPRGPNGLEDGTLVMEKLVFSRIVLYFQMVFLKKPLAVHLGIGALF
jgi:hypothetical protein